MVDKKEIVKTYKIGNKNYFQQKITYEQFEDLTEILDNKILTKIMDSTDNDIELYVRMFTKTIIKKIIPILLIEEGQEYKTDKKVKIKFNKIQAKTVAEVIRDFLLLNSDCGDILKSLIGQIREMIPQDGEWKIPENVQTSVT